MPKGQPCWLLAPCPESTTVIPSLTPECWCCPATIPTNEEAFFEGDPGKPTVPQSVRFGVRNLLVKKKKERIFQACWFSADISRYLDGYGRVPRVALCASYPRRCLAPFFACHALLAAGKLHSVVCTSFLLLHVCSRASWIRRSV